MNTTIAWKQTSRGISFKECYITKLKKNIFVLILILTVLFISCATNSNTAYSYNRENPYPGMEILRYANSQAYLFSNESSDKLIIVIEGGGWSSVLGLKQDGIWVEVQSGSQFLQELGNNYNFLILEKLGRQPGMDYIEDMEDRANYTAENLLACYSESINSYLADHAFSSIILIGVSEGALLLPLVYEQMINKNGVVAMVSIGYGGLSMYEHYKIISTTRSGIPSEVAEMFADLLDTYNPGKTDFPNSFEEDHYGRTYRYDNSFMHIRPFDYYKNINIPILFIHGRIDSNVVAESTAYIQENLPKKPFVYWYFPWAHQPGNLKELIQFREMVAEWIRETDK